MGTFRVTSDEFSNHNLPIGAVVTSTDPPEWADSSARWFTQGIDGDEVAIDPRDLVQED